LKAFKVRVVAPLPNKSTVGIEVHNPQRETVGLKDMLTSEVFIKARSKLALALGKDIYGRPVVTDLRTMPHLLVAGATGSGKSVGLNCLLLNILFTAHPDEVKLLLVDPKVLELQVYDGIPHLIRPVITNPKEAARGLSWVVQEMERRYRVLAELGVRNIDAYNRKVLELQETVSTGPRKKTKLTKGQSMEVEEAPGLETPIEERTTLPYIVVVIDEFADLMMVAPKDIEDRIARLAQMARASGIHLILATQRPSVDVVTGIIKANFPARIAYQVSSKTDSRTILDANGAESLLGKGDMLFLASGTGRIVRLHGPYVSDDEVRNVVEWVKSQAAPIYDEAALASVEESPAEDQEADETYERARELVMTTGQASASFIQRRLRVGYPRAARMIEQMESEGLVSAPGRDGRREVLARGTATAEIG
ncbi:MAG: FtsK/SpoIIIE domain-containing protein, partial [Nitrospirota bacterium]|nr:FtsK/SpoIIIE domain-containing protein [Nitrospirota bacterium]MDX2420130.1 FtsK/SpoIIIE domain-containing protein [Nitrospirota bacterium]